ncbi:DUF2977 domain-containing protein [Staphylococcus pseudintermedius]|uniref:DUF2977 domain-containing protein n=1 Tax=Staphylococcus TaxID=1279 RepID=UPI001931B5F5|nr:DUF2977 domain-containing protein [Staphylococcus pseudintermedius]EGQ3293769.1 DUF2977 domain-containing protein [Staphylococcus pseudintermedius]EGQ3835276.1 DUF2977 domain-containing protein [Staphylococcus pseudintermedius]EGQ4134004.1 DUF2977 domain-containing protein [Staphylococcus pseudintermedius]EGQ4284570.1 DUF2977 domain-containing protein [Staphylococcus pseudintermedius]EHK9622965.1 DUF2977 domain-containing protein [Staphylococcus pseudintermedius]
MQIAVNEKGEVLNYANIGSLGNGFYVDSKNIPSDFDEKFEPKRFIYNNGKIKENADFKPNNENHDELKDEELYKNENDVLKEMLASLQKQTVKANMTSMQLAQQNTSLTKQLTELSSEVKKLKESGV